MRPLFPWRRTAQAHTRPPRVLVVSSTYRTLDNFSDLLARITAAGGTVQLGLLPWSGDPSNAGFDTLPYPVAFRQPLAALSEEGLSREELARLLKPVLAAGIDAVLISDVQSYPSREVHSVVHALHEGPGAPPCCVGFQHGVYQSWHLYNAQFACDHLFCFGEAHLNELSPALRARATAVGLCKLDRLSGVATADRGYALFLAQKVPGPDVVIPALQSFEALTGTPVVIRDHPQYPGLYDFPSSTAAGEALRAQFSQCDLYTALAHCRFAISTHSTAAIEALYLGKPVVLLPNHGLAAFNKYPAIAQDFTGAAIRSALGQHKVLRHRVDEYLVDAVGGIRFDHTERAWKCMLSLLASH